MRGAHTFMECEKRKRAQVTNPNPNPSPSPSPNPNPNPIPVPKPNQETFLDGMVQINCYDQNEKAGPGPEP